jgi:hypothetical protein
MGGLSEKSRIMFDQMSIIAFRKQIRFGRGLQPARNDPIIRHSLVLNVAIRGGLKTVQVIVYFRICRYVENMEVGRQIVASLCVIPDQVEYLVKQ